MIEQINFTAVPAIFYLDAEGDTSDIQVRPG